MNVLITCPTYARIPFLGRVLASFLAQDYEDKHLVIVNDDKNVKVRSDRSNVTCINIDQKQLLPQKRNIANSVGYYDLIMPHDDDDLFLPNRVTNHVQIHTDNPEINLFRNHASFFTDSNVMTYGYCSPNACSYKRKAWWEVGGYEHQKHSGEDQEFNNKVTKKLIINKPEECDYIYNWGGINYHASHENIPYDIIAKEQLEALDLFGKEYWVEPDFEEYEKFIYLTDRLKQTGKDVEFEHVKLGKIRI